MLIQWFKWYDCSFDILKITSKLPFSNMRNTFNPVKVGVSKSIYSWGAFCAPPQQKALDYRYRVEMHVHSPIFHGQLKEKKINR